jgi:ABC-2 type transport system permease protein
MINVYRATFAASINVQLQYRIALAIWLIGLVVQPVMYLVVWQTVAGSGTVKGFSGGDFAAYFLVMMLATHVTFTWIMWEYEFMIKSGQLAAHLLRPLHPIHRHVPDNVGYKMLTLIVVVPAFIILAVLFHASFRGTVVDYVLCIPAVLIAAVTRFLLEYTLALAAFYTTRVSAVNQVWDALFWLLSGQIAPLALFPGGVQTVATLLPFRAMASFPVELALGRLDGRAIAQGFGLQAAWLVIAAITFRLLWRHGVKAFTAVGT